MTQNNSNGWDDEAAAMKGPELYRCQWCGKTFYKAQVRMRKENELVDAGELRPIGFFYCHDCIRNLKPEGCPLVAYDDPNQWNFLCFNCPIPDVECDLRGKTMIRTVGRK